MDEEVLDVAVVGGGPTGISACLELSERRGLGVALFESEAELGGIPRSCHLFFGLRDMKRLLSGPAYARKFVGLIRKTPVRVHTSATVLDVEPDPNGESHLIKVSSPGGVANYRCRFVVLATGCYEGSREVRLIPGSRPAGIYTTGPLQQVVNLHGLKPGRSAVVIGSEHVALSCALTLRRGGVSIASLVEEGCELNTYRLPARSISRWIGAPIYRNTEVSDILGKKRVEAVKLTDKTSGGTFHVDCDTVVCTGKFRPDAALIYNTVIGEDPASQGPLVDTSYMTTIPNVFAAGNILRGADMHDLCALEGRRAARSILCILDGKKGGDSTISLRPEFPIRFVVPQRLSVRDRRSHRASPFAPCVSLQLAHTVKRCTLEAWSDTRRVWSRSYSRIIGNTRIPVPIERFAWSRIDPDKPITLRLRNDESLSCRPARFASGCFSA